MNLVQVRTLVLALALFGCDSKQTADLDATVDRYINLGADGRPTTSQSVACVLDNLTNLTWERKSDQPGLHNWQNTYSWFDPSENQKEQDYRGTAAAGTCAGSDCDTYSVVKAAKAEMLCGHGDWRMPSRDELFSISDLAKAASPPTVNVAALPLTQAGEYWSANDYSFQPDSAWAWSFFYGHDRVDWKKTPKFVRLVRGEAVDLTAVKE